MTCRIYTATISTRPAPIEREIEAKMTQLSDAERIALEAAAFRRLVSHLQNRPDVQNIELMNLAGFCRNCLSNWYGEAAKDADIDLSKDEAREIIYGMPYEDWKAKNQRPASAAELAEFEKNRPQE